ncbi:MAG: Asp-tRNA(Asn)/Glu-tRNA(Gln) amidotransferase subunit GatC [Candidatus Omnitrophica bacterium]|nr:Asp-tRNA(Asn)/Glu-tRNA(Gln) amidotransferase subunit GatC [Candidatus Omnitrophota bacterium]
MPDIDKSAIEYLAKLARIKLKDEEMEKLIADLKNIIDYVSQLNQLNTENVEPAKHVLPYCNVCRKDVKKNSLPVEEVLKNAPERAENMFKVPGII